MPKKQLWEVIDEKKTADSTKDFEKLWKSQVPIRNPDQNSGFYWILYQPIRFLKISRPLEHMKAF